MTAEIGAVDLDLACQPRFCGLACHRLAQFMHQNKSRLVLNIGITAQLPVYCDVTLKVFDEVLPAAGSINSAVRIEPDRLAELAEVEWIDICQDASAPTDSAPSAEKAD